MLSRRLVERVEERLFFKGRQLLLREHRDLRGVRDAGTVDRRTPRAFARRQRRDLLLRVHQRVAGPFNLVRDPPAFGAEKLHAESVKFFEVDLELFRFPSFSVVVDGAGSPLAQG